MNTVSLFAIGSLGTTEILLLVFVVVLLFGAKKLPELARGLGKAKNEFQKASNEVEKELNAPDESPSTKSAEKTHSNASVPPSHN
jgi:sec-independent protein translocase protein TatA